METKQLTLQQTQVKMGAEGSLKFSGYASVFDGLDSYGDTVIAGAYKGTIAERDRPVQLRWNHYGPVIGKFTDMYEDEKGLFVEGELTKGHSTAEDAAALLRHGAISGMSIGYVVKDYEMDGVVRKLKDIELFEISLVESPADNNAHVTSIKSAESLKEIEAILRGKGFSQKEATEIVASVKKIHGEREAEMKADEDLQKLKLFIEEL